MAATAAVGGAVAPGATVEAPAAEPAAPEVAAPGGDVVEQPDQAAGAEAAPGAGPDQAGGQNNCQPAAPEPAQDAGEGGGGACGGGGGGGGAQDQPPPPAPDVSAAEPAEAVAQSGNLAPAEAQAAISGVNQSVNRSVDGERDDLANSPPEMERPSGAPPGKATQTRVPRPTPAGAAAPAPLDRVGADQSGTVPQPQQIAPQAAPLPSSPSVQLPGNAQITPSDADNIRAAVNSLPTTDPALNVSIDKPTVTLDGNADPVQVRDQSSKVADSVTSQQEQGSKDVAQPMGEDQVYPVVPAETLTATPEQAAGGAPQAAGGGGAAAGGQPLAPDDPVAIVAREQGQDQVRSAANTARSGIVSDQQKHTTDMQSERTKSQQAMDEEVAKNAEQQTATRNGVQTDVRAERKQWTDGQKKTVDDATTDRTRIQTENQTEVNTQRTDGDRKAAEQVKQGNAEIATQRKDAEGKAQTERQNAKNETSGGGFFSWLSSKVTSFFNRIKNAIKAAFEYARKAIQAAFKRFQELAMKAIDAARNAIVKAIRAAGDALIAIGDRVLAAFPTLRDRFRAAINKLVDKATAAVNALADALKAGLKKLLNALLAALNGLLNLLEKALLAYISLYEKAIQGVISAARAVAMALGAFLQLIKDIAANPGQWLSNLGSSVVSGIRNCLWSAFKSAVKIWFNQKVEEVLGLGLMIYKVLTQGCITMAEVGKMAWEGLKSAIPMVLISLLIEKLVSMIVPAAGAIMTIIQGLQAAWGTVSRIITAFQLFFTFLKAVKNGNAGPQFATAVAAAAVVVIDFVANWLLQRLMRPAKAVAGTAARAGAEDHGADRQGRAPGGRRDPSRLCLGAARRIDRVGGCPSRRGTGGAGDRARRSSGDPAQRRGWARGGESGARGREGGARGGHLRSTRHPVRQAAGSKAARPLSPLARASQAAPPAERDRAVGASGRRVASANRLAHARGHNGITPAWTFAGLARELWTQVFEASSSR